MKRLWLLIYFVFAAASLADTKKNEPNVSGKNKASEAKEQAKTPDQEILLESTFVGDKEQPSVSYFIPWKGNETPDKLRWNMEEKHDQALEIIDRDVLLNSMTIYNDMNLENKVADD